MKQYLIPIGLITFVNILGFAVLIPVLPFILEDLGGGAIAYGFLIALYPIFQFFGAPILGTLSDKYGRRPLLIVSQFGTLISWFIFGSSYFVAGHTVGPFSAGLFVIALSRIIDGITGGNFSVANAYITDVTPPEQKTRIFGLIGSIVGVGLIMGPVIGGYLSSTSLGYFAVIIFSIILSLVTIVAMYFLLPETLSKANRRKQVHFHVLTEINIYQKIMSYNSSEIRLLFFNRAFIALAFTAFTSTIVLVVKDNFNLTPREIGGIFLILGVFFVINQAYITPKLAKNFGTYKTFITGQLIMACGLLIIVPSNSVPMVMLAVYLANLGYSACSPTFKTLITNKVDATRQGEINGLDESVLAGASAIAPIMAAIIYFYINVHAYAFFAVILAIPHIIIWARRRLRTVRIG